MFIVLFRSSSLLKHESVLKLIRIQMKLKRLLKKIQRKMHLAKQAKESARKDLL